MRSTSLAILGLAALLAACAGQVQQVPFEPGARPSAYRLWRAHQKKGEVVVRIKIPKRHHHRHAPRFISPSTQSMTISISGPTTIAQTVNLTPTSSGCTSTLASTVCQLALSLSPGNYTATITTYDGLNGGGNALSTAQAVAFSVIAGSSNTIALTLSGIPASLAVLPDSATSTTNLSGGINLIGTGASRLLIEARDADGNLILGAGSPSYSVKAANGFAVTITQPTASGNTFTVKPPSTYSTNTATLLVTASFSGQATNGCTQTGEVCAAYVPVSMQEVVGVLSSSGVILFAEGDSTPFATVTSGLSAPRAVAFDAGGNLYVANSGNNSISIYAPPYKGPPQSITSGVSDPVALAFDGSGNLYVANESANTVTQYSPPFSSSSTPSLTLNGSSSLISAPDALAFNGAALFVANATGNAGSGSVTEYASPAPGATPTVIVTNSVSAPNALALDARGSLYVSNSVSGCNSSSTVTVEKYSPPYSGTPLSFGTANVSCPSGVVVATVNGYYGSHVFVANSSAGSIDTVTQFALSGTFQRTIAASDPTALATDEAGNLFVGSGSANDVTFYTPSSFYLSSVGPQLTMPGVPAPSAMAVLP